MPWQLYRRRYPVIAGRENPHKESPMTSCLLFNPKRERKVGMIKGWGSFIRIIAPTTYSINEEKSGWLTRTRGKWKASWGWKLSLRFHLSSSISPSRLPYYDFCWFYFSIVLRINPIEKVNFYITDRIYFCRHPSQPPPRLRLRGRYICKHHQKNIYLINHSIKSNSNYWMCLVYIQCSCNIDRE